LQAVRRLILNIKPKDIGSLISNFPGEDPKMLSSFKDLLDKIFILDPEKRITVSQALIALDIELSIYLVKYNLGSSCLIIDISVLCPGSYETKYMDEARNYGRDGYLQTLLHALIIWICSVACKTTSQLAFHSLYYTLYYGFKRYT
jgi:serine/threonine protein kinase